MSLLALQRDFHAYLVDAPNTLPSHIGLAASCGLAIYHNAYHVQLADCLSETFTHTLAWLGGYAFVEAASKHIECTPPSGWTLDAYGEGFDRTLATLYPNDPEVAELARLEWLLSKAFAAEDANALPNSAIAGIDWDNAALNFTPTLQTVPTMTNAGAIWSALTAGDPPPAAVLLPEPATMLVWRQGFTPCFRTIDALEHQAIMMTAAATSFADLCAMLVEELGEKNGLAFAGQMLGQWFADGLIHEVRRRKVSCA
jgi:hypothetical protein